MVDIQVTLGKQWLPYRLHWAKSGWHTDGYAKIDQQTGDFRFTVVDIPVILGKQTIVFLCPQVE